MRQRLKCYYDERVVPTLRDVFQYKNPHQIPRIEKIIVNRGLGEVAQSNKILESSLEELTTITTQRRVVTRARKAIAGFKLRKKMPIGLRVTLRGDRIYAFLDRLMNLALPRIRDFQGVNPMRFDSRGNYNLGLEEQLIFPEIQYDQIDHLCGINFSIVTTARTDKERFVLLKELGIPFQKKEPKLISQIYFYDKKHYKRSNHKNPQCSTGKKIWSYYSKYPDNYFSG